MPATVQDPFHRRLRARLVEELEAQRDALCNNFALDFPDYRYCCGRIVMLQQVLQVAEEIEAEMYTVEPESPSQD